KSTTPALMHSPRSTRGTTRHSAYWNSSRGASGILGLLGERARRGQPLAQVRDVVVAARLAAQPLLGDGAHHAAHERAVEARRQARVGLGDGAGVRQQHVLANAR